MKELGISKGNWRVEADDHELYIETYDREICKSWTNNDEARNNMNLIADAGNTAQKCGLLPSELLRQRDRALLTLCNCRETIEMLQKEIPGEQLVLRHEMTSRLKDIETAIKSTEQ